jgi:hypothetical protein
MSFSDFPLLVSLKFSCPFIPSLLTIVLSVLLPFMTADYPFGIFQQNIKSEVLQLYSWLIFSFMCMLYRSLFVLLYFFFWPLCCMLFFDIRILLTSLVSSNSS